MDTAEPSVSDDGSIVVFVRGHTLNREGWGANPTSNPERSRAGRLGRARRGRPRLEARRGHHARALAGRPHRRLREGRPDLRLRRRRRRAAAGHREGREAAHQGGGQQLQPEVVARRHEARVRQRPRRSQLHRRLRRPQAHGHLPVAERRPRHQPDLVGRRQAHRVHPPARPAVRPAGAGRHGRHRQSSRPGLQPRSRRARPGPARRRGAFARGSGDPGARRRPARGERRQRRGAPLASVPGLYSSQLPGGYRMAILGGRTSPTGDAHEFWHPRPAT